MGSAGALVRSLWDRMQDRDWAGAEQLLAADFVCDWPAVGHRFRGAANFIAMNRAHPAPNWQIHVEKIVESGEIVAAEVVVTSDTGRDACVGLYEVQDHMISRGTEYWIELTASPIPEWRRGWTEALVG